MRKEFSFTDVIRHINDMVIVTKADSANLPGLEQIYVNEAFTRPAGYHPERWRARLPILQDPNTNPKARAQIGAALRNQEPVRAEVIITVKARETYAATNHNTLRRG